MEQALYLLFLGVWCTKVLHPPRRAALIWPNQTQSGYIAATTAIHTAKTTPSE